MTRNYNSETKQPMPISLIAAMAPYQQPQRNDLHTTNYTINTSPQGEFVITSPFTTVQISRSRNFESPLSTLKLQPPLFENGHIKPILASITKPFVSKMGPFFLIRFWVVFVDFRALPNNVSRFSFKNDLVNFVH